MLPKLAALLVAVTVGAGPFALADPIALAGGQSPPAALQAADASIARPTRTLWGKGQVLPPEYRRTNLKDWDRYGLPPAPAGYQWVSVGQNAYIVDVSSGEISGAFIGVLTD